MQMRATRIDRDTTRICSNSAVDIIAVFQGQDQLLHSACHDQTSPSYGSIMIAYMQLDV